MTSTISTADTLNTRVVIFSLLAASVASAQVDRPWKMHHIRDDYIIANSLNQADVNGDGFPDYSVIDERLGLQTIIFHPGKNGDVRKQWPRVELGKTGNPEYSCLGDLDGDGRIDLVVVEGDDLEKGYETGVRVWWGPDAKSAAEPAAWTNAGHVPGTGGQQYLYAECHDINGDGALDIVIGGRRNSMTKQYAGIRWLESPKAPGDRRDLGKWTQHFIDANTLSGHAFVMADIDQDGDADLIDADADWDTPKFDQQMHWYENPGPASDSLRKPWQQHRIWRSAQFYAKPQVGTGDVNGDGMVDLVTQTQNAVHLFIKTTNNPVKFQKTTITKPDSIQWVGRPIKFADLNADGKLDIVGALIHLDGMLPADKASVFWMEYEGSDPSKADAWKTHTIKPSDGHNSRKQWIGEKWDHLLFSDVDGDGDLDIVGNVEEHFDKGPDGNAKSFFSVVWFENPLK